MLDREEEIVVTGDLCRAGAPAFHPHSRRVGDTRRDGARPLGGRTPAGRLEIWSREGVDEKISPYLVPWCDLTDEVREWDRQTVRALPDFLAKASFEIYRLR